MKYIYKWYSIYKNRESRKIQQHAEEGWRFVQIFAPGTGTVGSADNFELIFEKTK